MRKGYLRNIMEDNEVKSKKVYLSNYGCQMNVRDSEVICGLLKDSGYKICSDEKQADVIIFNTCSVRQHAEDRVWSQIGAFKKTGTVKRKRNLRDSPQETGTVPIIGIVGCMAKNYAEKIFERSPDVDFAVGPQDIDKIPDILSRLSRNKEQSPKSGDSPLFQSKIWETDGQIRPDEIYHNNFYQDKEHAYLVISEGCSNFCSYCVVPYVRGGLRHRKVENILREAQGAIAQGITRITLLGQNVNAYQNGDIDFSGLLQRLDKIDGLKQINFFTSHPKDADPDFFKVIRDSQKLVKSLHLPLQSGSDKILKLMNRGYSAKEYLALIDSYRKIVKGGLLTSDIIVGFPGESEDDFSRTFELVNKAEFNAAYIFKYSPRPHTEALKMADDVERADKEKRHARLLELQRGISNKKNAKRR
ncbi:MAG: tRNA (N6-isopentenyl adenosine(37)-C2)-methylthiotransferase MiaB [Candidatus Omnitrophica bacterium]|nr:tRNA (N6-isopentenyl adenosine(37)-C2)-methylthiotransferase MiaB [Candidatus Omnitrophota bacterium]